MQPVIDLTPLRELTGGNLEIERLLFDLYMEGAARSIAALEEAHARDALDDWRRESHYLKGASANLGARRLACVCAEAEALDATDWPLAEDLLRRISREYADVCRILRDPDSGGEGDPSTAAS